MARGLSGRRRRRPRVPSERTTRNNEVVVAPNRFSDDLVDMVWSHLPIVSAARFSLASSKYKDLWKHSRNLIFDKSVVRGKNKREVFVLVFSAMSKLPKGHQIDKFSLYVNPKGIWEVICSWIAAASSMNVQEVELDFSSSCTPQPLGICLKKANTLTSLKLVNVRLEVSLTMKEWSTMIHLRRLILKGCDMNYFENVLKEIWRIEYLEIIKCKNMSKIWRFRHKLECLRTLKIGGCQDLLGIEVDAPNLTHFYYHGNRRQVSVASRLERMFFTYSNMLMKRNAVEYLEYDLMDDFAESLKVLTVNANFIEAICPIIQLWDLGATEAAFPNLVELHIYMETYTCQTVEYVRFLLKCCPLLETLHIDMGYCKADGGKRGFAERKDAHYADTEHFHQLKVIKIKGFRCSDQEQDLLEYIVARSENLETVALVAHKNYVRPRFTALFLKQHLINISFSRGLKISIYDFDDDRSCISPSQTKSWYSST